MNDSNYNERIITRYLLGALSEVETERLDELSVRDDGFARALTIAEKELVDAYVQGELTRPTWRDSKNITWLRPSGATKSILPKRFRFLVKEVPALQ